MERIIVKNVAKSFNIGYKENKEALVVLLSFFSGRELKKSFLAVNDVSFSAQSGEIVGIIGANGSGKTNILKIVSGIYRKDRGIVKTHGKIIPLINLGMVLKKRLTLKDNVYLCGALFGLSHREIKCKFDEIVEFAELNQFIYTKMYQLSLGMMTRCAFSIAIHSKPDIILLDEVFAVSDEGFRKKGLEKIKDLVDGGATVLLVSHDMELIKNNSHKVLWLSQGRIVLEGKAEKIIPQYLMNKELNSLPFPNFTE